MSQYGQRPQIRFGFGGGITPAIKVLMIVNAAVFVVQILLRIAWPAGLDWFIDWFALTPTYAIKNFRVWQFITHAFLHNTEMFWHILFNMFVLWMFGCEVERVLGRSRFLVLYFAAALAGGLCMMPWYFIDPDIPILGASGAVFGMMAMFAKLFPHRQVHLLGVFPMKVRTLALSIVGIEVLAQLISGLAGGDGIAHLAHLGGFALGWFFLSLERSTAQFQRARQFKKTARSNREEREVREEVDELLAKVGRDGLNSLTRRERAFLKRASKRYNK